MGHVSSPVEVMGPMLSPKTHGGYAVGDLAGLAQLGAGGCFVRPLR
jgi:hypothetical protein